MPDEVDRQVYSLVKIICVSQSGVDSDICLVMMTLTALYCIDSDTCVHIMTSICVNAKMPDEVN